MLDNYFCKKATSRDVLSTPGYNPKNVILKQPILNPGSDILTVLFPPWHADAEGWPFDYLTRRLIKRGHSVLPYTFHGELLKPNAKEVLESFTQVQHQVSDRLKELSRVFKTINLTGISLGGTALTMIAEEFQGFSTATLVVPGSNLAYCVYNGMRTGHLREALECGDEHWTYEHLDNYWQQVAPIKHVDAFKGKKVAAYISKTDEVIPAESQREIVDGLINAGAIVTEHSTRLGHLATVGRYCLAGRLD